ncbi:YdcF family protein [Nonomuraea sp. MTCD27]|uniref:YdcF family protein n=1 Tax=Nonomuraea sp. MTCD27 TaxID=1676747 RepID=UPI0035BF1C13
MTDDLGSEQIAAITAFVDTEALPPDGRPTALILFGTMYVRPPVEIAAERYHRGLAPLIIATGGVNRHDGTREARTFRRLLLERGVPDDAIRCEDRSLNTWQNVELSLPFLHEALASGLAVTAVCKWYHRRALHMLKTLVPGLGPFHGITWEPPSAGRPITRTDWPAMPGGRKRVMREWEEVSRRVADGSLQDLVLTGGAWH